MFLVWSVVVVGANMGRLNELFQSLRETHGGPAYITRQALSGVHEQARERLESLGDDCDEEGFARVCAWVMTQLKDPLASHLRPVQAVAARERFHGRIGLGLTLKTTRLPCSCDGADSAADAAAFLRTGGASDGHGDADGGRQK